MKRPWSRLHFLLFLTVFTSCVTTREELYQRKLEGVEGAPPAGEPDRAVRSEDLKPSAPATAGTPAPEATPTPSPEATPPPVAPPFALPAVSPTPAPSVAPILKPEVADYGTEELRAELARVAGLAEELRHEKETGESRSNEELKRANERIAALEKQLKDLTPEVPKLPEGKSPFQAGKDAYLAGNLDEAVHFLTESLTASEAGREAEEALYLRGETQFKKQQYNKAIVDFSRITEKFPKSTYHSKALLRIAESFEALARKEEARAFYSELLEKFPKTAEGMIAKKRLKARP